MKYNWTQVTVDEDTGRLLLVDFNDQYHVVRRVWGDRKINVSALSQRFEDTDERMAFIKSPVLGKVKPFDRVLQDHNFSRCCLYAAPKWANCTALIAAAMVNWLHCQADGVHVEIDVISSDPHLDVVASMAEHLDFTYARWSYDDNDTDTLTIPSSLLTPIPVSNSLELDYAAGLDS